MKIIGRLFPVFIIVLALILGTCTISLGSEGDSSGSGTGEKAYIFIGDVNPPWYSLLLRSSFGEVDPYKELQPVIEAQKKKLEAMGYTVTIQPIAIENDLRSALQDPATKAVAWFGHGDEGIPGTIYTAHEEETITPGDIAEWTREQLAKEVGTPDTWKGLPDLERKELMKHWNDAHFNLEYAYFHTCYGMKNNDLVDVLMADDGQFYGYSGTAGISDTSEKATSIRGKPAKEQGFSGIVPAMPIGETQGSVWSGEAISEPKNGKTWPFKLTLIGPDSDGLISGQIEWPSLNSINKIEGHKTGNALSFTETADIQKGGAVLSCKYDVIIEGNSFNGKWSGCDDGDYGTINGQMTS
ncbi:hypothetical protein [Methanothrix sp.]|uniref:hypothetical protein n=1 Tax=Methanothrix sp. TaxID=90426 RepID=UPI003BB4BAB8